jgi:TolB protein
VPSPRLHPAFLALACAALLPACDGGGGGGPTQPTPLTVQTSGRLERGSTIAVTVSNGSQTIPLSQLAVSFSPAGAAQVVGDSVHLLVAGHVTATVTQDDHVGTAELDVAAPPVVVFDRLQSGNRDIWRIDLDGQNLTQLTTDPGDDQEPTAAKGTVVFVSYRGGNGDLYSVPLAGGTTTRLTNTPRDETTPSLSPDGAKLAYSWIPTDVSKIYTSTATGSNAAQLEPGTGAEVIETAPSWSPSGTLAFVSTVNGTADIFTSTGPGQQTLLVGGPQAEVEPAFSPDGKTVAFVSNRNGGVDIFLVTVASGAVTQLTSGPATKSEPAWTPDGRIVYLETVGSTTHLRWIDPAAPTVTHLIDTGAGTVGHPSVAVP